MSAAALGAWLDALTRPLVDPDQRLFLGYLASALVIALAWLIARRGLRLGAAAREIFSRASWWSRSARADYRVMAINTAVMLVLSPRLLGQLGVSLWVFESLHGLSQGRPAPVLPDWAVVLGFTTCLFLLDDFSRYLVHRLLHRVPLLWAFHKVHHTATTLNPLTVYRTHPVEGVVFVLRSALVHGACTGTFVFFFGGQVTLATVLGASVFTVAFNALGANLRHSHVALGFWRPLERVFISPGQHQIHHSLASRHMDRNFGAVLAVWDVLFASHCFSEPQARLRFGVRGATGKRAHGVAALYARPFQDAWAGFTARGPGPRCRYRNPVRRVARAAARRESAPRPAWRCPARSGCRGRPGPPARRMPGAPARSR